MSYVHMHTGATKVIRAGVMSYTYILHVLLHVNNVVIVGAYVLLNDREFAQCEQCSGFDP